MGKFVEFFGPGLAALSLADRATIANMAPEYGATCGIFPVDDETLRYLRLTGRNEQQIALVEAYCKEQGLFAEPDPPRRPNTPRWSSWTSPRSSRAWPVPSGPRIGSRLGEIRQSFETALPSLAKPKKADGDRARARRPRPRPPRPIPDLKNGSVVIAAITSCTNTSNPSVLVAAGLLAKKAVGAGPDARSPGSRPRWRPARRS